MLGSICFVRQCQISPPLSIFLLLFFFLFLCKLHISLSDLSILLRSFMHPWPLTSLYHGPCGFDLWSRSRSQLPPLFCPSFNLSHTHSLNSQKVCFWMCVCVSESWSWLFLNASDMRSLASTKLVQTSHCDDVREWLMHDKTETGGAVCACVRACVCVYEHVSKVGCGFYATSYTKWNSKPANRFPKPKPAIGWDMQWWLLKMKQSLYIFVYRKYDYKVYTYFCSFLLTFILDFRCP